MPPTPDQTSFRSSGQLEIFRNPQAFNPKDFVILRCRHHQLPPPGARNFPVRKQILKFHRRPQTNRLKPVARTPMAERDPATNLVRVKRFTGRPGGGSLELFQRVKPPAHADASKDHLPCPAREFDDRLVGLENRRPGQAQADHASRIAQNGKLRAKADWNIGRLPERFDQLKIRRHAGLRQLQLQSPPLNRNGQIVKGRDAAPGRPHQFFSAIVARFHPPNPLPRRRSP